VTKCQKNGWRCAISEHDEQVAVFEWAALHEGRLPELALLFHVPNGGKRAPITAARLKAEGVKPGVLDLWLPVARLGKHGLVIEMKCKGGRVSDAQRVWITALRREGYHVEVCYNWTEAVNEIETYLTWDIMKEI
jgi:hypothetical protein